MNQSNVVSLRIGGATSAGDVVGIRADASVVKMDHEIGPILGADIDTTANSFTVTNHQLVTGDKIKYLKGSGATVAGLSSGTSYHAIVVDENTFKLAADLAKALAGTPVVAITNAGGDTHTFTHQVAKEKAVGVVVHDVDAKETGQPVAIQLFNHGMFIANADGSTAIVPGDIVQVVDNSSLVAKGTTTPKGFALDALASGTGLIRVLSS